MYIYFFVTICCFFPFHCFSQNSFKDAPQTTQQASTKNRFTLNSSSPSVELKKEISPPIVFESTQCDILEAFLQYKNTVNTSYIDVKTKFYASNGALIPLEWMTTKEHFRIWDEETVNPYQFKIKTFKDTVSFSFPNICFPLKIDSLVVNSKYGSRRWKWHNGVDIDIEKGEKIYAVLPGIVRIARYNRGGYGYYVLLRHKNGLETLYGHLEKMKVTVGQEVKSGEIIGIGGNTGRSTGRHLHFEIRYKGHSFNPSYIFDISHRSYKKDFILMRKHFIDMINFSNAVYYRIRRGDSLWDISRKFRTSIARICRLNRISRRKVLYPGKRLRVR